MEDLYLKDRMIISKPDRDDDVQIEITREDYECYEYLTRAERIKLIEWLQETI